MLGLKLIHVSKRLTGCAQDSIYKKVVYDIVRLKS